MEPISFKKWLSLANLVSIVNRLPPLKTFIMDLVYPETVRRNHPFDKLGKDDLGLPTKNIPLVTRGSASYALTAEPGGIDLIDPANFTPSITLTAADCNRFRGLGIGGQQIFIDNNIDKLRRTVRKSTEALAIQSLTGQISYDIRTSNGTLDVYNVKFGTIAAIAISKKWDATGTKVGDITADIGKLHDAIHKTSDGTDIIHLIKYDVYAALVNKAAETNNTELIKVYPDYVQIGTAKFYLCSSQYYSYKTKAYVDAIPDKSVVSLARDDAFSLFYCALDSFDADFAALPFFVKEEKLSDPDGMKFIGQSRPMPVPNVAAMRTAKVLG